MTITHPLPYRLLIFDADGTLRRCYAPGAGLPMSQQIRLWQGRQIMISQRGRSYSSFLSRFWAKVTIPEHWSQCWEWQAAQDKYGYGFIKRLGRRPKAHQVVWHLYYGSYAFQMTIDHLCRNRLCVNPAHLETVSSIENVMRGNSLPAQYARRHSCSKGHAYTKENTAIATKMKHGHVMTYRSCRLCARLKSRIRRQGASHDSASIIL